MVLREYDTVRVVRLLEFDREFRGTDGVVRPPVWKPAEGPRGERELG